MSARIVLILKASWPRALVRAQLRALGYEVVTAASVAGALRTSRAARTGPAVLLVLESRMAASPGTDGALKELREMHEAPRVLLIGTPDGPAPEWCATLPRPLRAERVLEAIEAILRGGADAENARRGERQKRSKRQSGRALASP